MIMKLIKNFEARCKRWKNLFRTDFSCQDDAWKMRQVVCKLGSNEQSRFVDHILLKQPKDMKFDEVILFSIRYEYLKIGKRDTEGYGMLTDLVNQDADIRTRLSSKLDLDPGVNRNSFMADSRHLLCPKHDTALAKKKIHTVDINQMYCPNNQPSVTSFKRLLVHWSKVHHVVFGLSVRMTRATLS
ncbi:unnamed protein product [Echinostoma caproni]|uniref:DNA-directed RNA polymerase n=1 Tax=Echinostoma caproni TaxID=27848 RepID=A0A183AS22_9TREM|nr:unnamed protein product [Echinostoma caproni]